MRFVVRGFGTTGVKGEVVFWNRAVSLTLSAEQVAQARVPGFAWAYQLDRRLQQQHEARRVRWWHDRTRRPWTSAELPGMLAEWTGLDSAHRAEADALLRSVRAALAEAHRAGGPDAVRAYCSAHEARLLARAAPRPLLEGHWASFADQMCRDAHAAAAFEDALTRFKAEYLPRPDELRARREAARHRVAAARDAIFTRVMRTHGLPLPDHYFTYLTWQAGLAPIESAIYHEVLEMGSRGIGALPLDPLAVEQLRPGIDDRLVWRYYYDPPEFLTVIHGGTDGLHYGLWYDDPRDGCAGVASYYNNDSCEIFWKGETLLTAVRETLERCEDWATGYTTDPTFVIDQRVRLAVLRQSVLEYETADLPGIGRESPLIDVYDSYARSRPFYANRIATRDSIGVTVPGAALGRDPAGAAALIEAGGDAAGALIAEALAECAAGRPAPALALGRDIFSMSQGRDEREAAAAQLLGAAYRALGRDALAEIVAVHTRYRRLPEVDDFGDS